MAGKSIGQIQGYLLSEIFHANGWTKIDHVMFGSNYGGKKKHRHLIGALESRGLVEVKSESGEEFVRAKPEAADYV